MRAEWEFKAKLANAIEKRDRPGTGGELVSFWGREAAFYTWALEPPKPVVSDEGRERAHRRMKNENKPMYLWADKTGTHVRSTHPGRKCEVIERQGPPRKKRKLGIDKGLRTKLLLESQAHRSIG